MKNSNAVLIFGEVLIDRFENGLERRGGAPFNVAWHLCGLGKQPFFISRIGQDEAGRQLLDDMQKWNLQHTGVQLDNQAPTGFVTVKNSSTNPEFDIHPEVAYDFIDPNEISPEILNSSFGLIYHGSLALRNPLSRSAFEFVLSTFKNVPVFFDVNLRPPWWDLETIRHYLGKTSYLKCNESELRLLVPDQDDPMRTCARLLEEFGLQSVIVTQGEKGAFLYNREGKIYSTEPEANISVRNSVGAGDGFSAVMILGILNQWPEEVTLKRANLFGSAICGIDGAVPDTKDFYKFINKLQD